MESKSYRSERAQQPFGVVSFLKENIYFKISFVKNTQTNVFQFYSLKMWSGLIRKWMVCKKKWMVLKIASLLDASLDRS